MSDTAELPIDRKLVWSMRDLRALTGLSRSTIERMVARGELPSPSKMGKHSVWNAQRMRARIDELTTQAAGGTRS